VLIRYGMVFTPDFNFSHPAIRRIFRLMGPTVFGLAIVQINVLLDSMIAIGFAPSADGGESFMLFGKEILYPLKTGAASVLYYGDRLIQFPLGVFGIALANVIFPLFSRYAAHEEWDGFRSALEKAVRMILFIGVPASVGLILLRQPLVELFYERNEFNAESSARTISVIFYYSVAVWAYCGLHVVVRAFYSLKDTTTPMKVGVYMVAANLVMNLSLIWFFKVGGLAFATSISAILQLIVLFVILKRRLNMDLKRDIFLSIGKTAISTVAMTAICWYVKQFISQSFPDGDTVSKFARLLIPLAVSLAAFFLFSFLVKSDELRLVMKKERVNS